MTQIDPTCTPGDAYLILRKNFDRPIGGEVKAAHIRVWLTADFHTLPGTSSDPRANLLCAMVLTNLAVYLQCDFECDKLVAGLHAAAEMVEAGELGIPKLLATPCGLSI